MRIVYENKKPKFALGCDKYQWILAKTKDKRGSWSNFTYHPNLSNLLDELAEVYFKKHTNKLKDIKDLNNSITKVYDLILKVSTTLGR